MENFSEITEEDGAVKKFLRPDGIATAMISRFEGVSKKLKGQIKIGTETFDAATVTKEDFEDYFESRNENVEITLANDCQNKFQLIVDYKDMNTVLKRPIEASFFTTNHSAVLLQPVIEEPVYYKHKYPGVLLHRLPGSMLRQAKRTPQVTVEVDEIPAICMTNCDFELSKSNYINEVVQDVSNENLLTIQFNSSLTDAIESITVGTRACTNVQINGVSVSCEVQGICSGEFDVLVKIVGFGYANCEEDNCQARFAWGVSSVSPLIGSTEGGLHVTVTGSNFCKGSFQNIRLGNEKVEVISLDTTEAVLKMPKSNSSELIIDQVYNFETSSDKTPTIDRAWNFFLHGSSNLQIAGTNFGSGLSQVSVLIDGRICNVSSVTNTRISCQFNPVSDIKNYTLSLNVGTKGNAELFTIYPTLEVSSIYPKTSGLIPGEILEIHGKGFGNDATKVSMLSFGISEIPVSLEIVSVSNTLIKAKHVDTAFKTVHKVDTSGTQTVLFQQVPNFSPENLVINKGETVEWCWRLSAPVSMKINFQQNGNTFSSEGYENSNVGCLSRYFDAVGIITYETDFIDENESIKFSGSITVEEADRFEKFEISVDSHTPTNNFVAKTSNSNCFDDDTEIISDLRISRDTAFTPKFNQFLQTSNTFDNDVIQLTFTTDDVFTIGLLDTSCFEIYVAEHLCTSKTVSGNSITCNVESNFNLHVFEAYEVSIVFKNYGKAVHSSKPVFQYEPIISAISPTKGSKNGGQIVTVSGNSLNRNTITSTYTPSFRVNGVETSYQIVDADSLTFETPWHAAEQNVEIKLTYSHSQFPNLYHEIATSFSYLDDDTPTLAVLPGFDYFSQNQNFQFTGTNIDKTNTDGITIEFSKKTGDIENFNLVDQTWTWSDEFNSYIKRYTTPTQESPVYNFKKAYARCQNLHPQAQIIEVRNLEQLEALNSYMNTNPAGCQDTLVGIRRISDDTDRYEFFYISDNSTFNDFSEDLWHPGNPSGGWEKYVEVVCSTGKLNDIHRHDAHSLVCQIPNPGIETITRRCSVTNLNSTNIECRLSSKLETGRWKVSAYFEGLGRASGLNNFEVTQPALKSKSLPSISLSEVQFTFKTWTFCKNARVLLRHNNTNIWSGNPDYESDTKLYSIRIPKFSQGHYVVTVKCGDLQEGEELFLEFTSGSSDNLSAVGDLTNLVGGEKINIDAASSCDDNTYILSKDDGEISKLIPFIESSSRSGHFKIDNAIAQLSKNYFRFSFNSRLETHFMLCEDTKNVDSWLHGIGLIKEDYSDDDRHTDLCNDGDLQCNCMRIYLFAASNNGRVYLKDHAGSDYISSIRVGADSVPDWPVADQDGFSDFYFAFNGPDFVVGHGHKLHENVLAVLPDFRNTIGFNANCCGL